MLNYLEQGAHVSWLWRPPLNLSSPKSGANTKLYICRIRCPHSRGWIGISVYVLERWRVLGFHCGLECCFGTHYLCCSHCQDLQRVRVTTFGG